MQPFGMMVKHYHGVDMPHILYCVKNHRIQHMQPEQLDACMDIWLRGNLQAHAFIPASYWRGAADSVREALPCSEIWVDLEGDTVRGFIGLQEDYIAGLFVAPAFQGKGVGGGLLVFSQKKHRALTLEVYEKNGRAVRFYQKHGFHLVEQHIDDATGETAYRMFWQKDSRIEAVDNIIFRLDK